MNTTLALIRIIFTILCGLFVAAYIAAAGATPLHLGIGALLGLILAAGLFCTEFLFKRIDIRSLNLATLGLLFGFFFGQALVWILDAVVPLPDLAKAAIYLVSTYIGMSLVVRASQELYFSIPFVRFQPALQKRKDLLLDQSAIGDTRLIDLASSGLMDNQLLVPRFLLKELYQQLESLDETTKSKARRSLEVLKKLEAIPSLGLRFVETDFPEINDSEAKLVRLGRLCNANIVSSDMNRVKQSTIEASEGIKVINLNTLSNALKPLTQSGETLEIKVQRYGKEPGQGVGYLEDGTMVVVNGGAEFIGRTIKSHVLSVKHTSSGRMIFCNASDEYEYEDPEPPIKKDSLRSYFAYDR